MGHDLVRGHEGGPIFLANERDGGQPSPIAQAGGQPPGKRIDELNAGELNSHIWFNGGCYGNPLYFLGARRRFLPGLNRRNDHHLSAHCKSAGHDNLSSPLTRKQWTKRSW
jgi:hypothetical protein